jgi:membrane-bound ClpP family serine protease
VKIITEPDEYTKNRDRKRRQRARSRLIRDMQNTTFIYCHGEEARAYAGRCLRCGQPVRVIAEQGDIR